MKMRWTIGRAAILFTAYASFSSPAYAYLDPATGSILIQVAIGVTIAWLLYAKGPRAKAKALFTRLTGKPAEPTGD